MTKPDPKSQVHGTVPPVAKAEDLAAFQGPVPLAVKAQAKESQGREAAEYHGQHAVPARAEHNTIPNQRVLLEKTPVPPPPPKVDPPGVTTDPGARRDPKPKTSLRGLLIAAGVFFLFVSGAVFAKITMTDPREHPGTPSATAAPLHSTAPSATATETTSVTPTLTTATTPPTVHSSARPPSTTTSAPSTTATAATTTSTKPLNTTPMPSVSGFVPEN